MRPARLAASGAAMATIAAVYMLYEAQAVECRVASLRVPGLPPPWRGTTVFHLSDVHAGLFPTNERCLHKAVRWAETHQPDLVLLTGDVLGDPARSRPCLQLLRRLRPPLGMFAVTGNHEYGLGKSPLARARDVSPLWEEAGVVLLRDTCHLLPPRDGTALALCGADYLTGGFDLHPPALSRITDCKGAVASAGAIATADVTATAAVAETAASTHSDARATAEAIFPILLIHEPPPPDSPLAARFPLAFAGHTHGGQLRVPGTGGLRPLYDDAPPRGLGKPDGDQRRPDAGVPGAGALSGVFRWGQGRLVVSRGVGTSFLPFRLLTRPEATIWRLV